MFTAVPDSHAEPPLPFSGHAPGLRTCERKSAHAVLEICSGKFVKTQLILINHFGKGQLRMAHRR